MTGFMVGILIVGHLVFASLCVLFIIAGLKEISYERARYEAVMRRVRAALDAEGRQG